LSLPTALAFALVDGDPPPSTNVVWIWDRCAKCKKLTRMCNYDMTITDHVQGLKFSIGTPIHIIDSCHICRKTRKIHQDERHATIQEHVEPVFAAYQKDKGDAELALAALDAAKEYRSQLHFKVIAPQIKSKFSKNSQMWLKLADAYAFFFMADEATRAYEKYLAAEDDPDVRHKLAYHFLYFAKPEEAREEVERCIVACEEDGMEIGLLYIIACQARGKHKDALEMIGQLTKSYRQVEKDGRFAEKKKLSLREKESGKPMGGKELAVHLGNPMPATRRDKKIGLSIAAAVVIIPSVIYLIACIIATPSVYLVGGDLQEYQVLIDQEEFTVPKQGVPSPLALGWGEHQLIASSNGLEVESIQFNLDIPFFFRAFDKTSYVINPDKGAIVTWTEAEYRSRPPPPVTKHHSGKAFYKFPDIEFPFRPLPDSIDTDKYSETRRSLELSVPEDETQQ
jgi:tetratricopeptide (TPR) repeat protein